MNSVRFWLIPFPAPGTGFALFRIRYQRLERVDENGFDTGCHPTTTLVWQALHTTTITFSTLPHQCQSQPVATIFLATSRWPVERLEDANTTKPYFYPIGC